MREDVVRAVQWTAAVPYPAPCGQPSATAGEPLLLAAATAHEMSGPMACLTTNLRTLADGLAALASEGSAPAAELVEAAHDALADAGRLADLVHSFRELARPGAGPCVRFDPAGPVADALRLFRASRPACEVRVEAPPSLPDLDGASSGVCHVLLNLLENGADAMGGAGCLRLAIRSEEAALVLRVADDGPGIPPAVAARMFEPWFTTKARGRGTGLGLWLCREIVQGLGGRIGFESGPSGTTFEVVLPVAT